MMRSAGTEVPVRVLTSAEISMLHYAVIFFVIALIAAVFGFAGIAGELAWIGKVLLVVFLVLAIVSMIMGRRAPRIG